MTPRQWKYTVVVVVAVVLIGGGLSYWPAIVAISQPHGDTAGQEGSTAESREPRAKVTVMDLHRRMIEETLTVYGSTLPAPDESQTFSVPYECQVQRVFVTAGRVVELGPPPASPSCSPGALPRADAARPAGDPASWPDSSSDVAASA